MKGEKNTSGLNVPNGYFENFEDRMMSRVMEDSLPKSNGFAVPKGYFDTLEGSVLSQISESRETKVIPLFGKRRLLYVAGIAASLLLIISLWGGRDDDLSLNDLSANQVEAYIDEGGIAVDSYDVLALLEEEDLSEITIPSEEISEENLENYLLENFDENSLLVE